MNVNSEQINAETSVIIAQDQPLTTDAIFDVLKNNLGPSNISKQTILGRKVFVYQKENTKIILLTKAITYLGNPHPIYKKRIQLPDWYQEFCNKISETKQNYDVRFLGVYHFDGNIIFVDFVKDSYLKHGLHNSSAHVYINDLFMGMNNGTFQKQDKNGNIIVSINVNNIKSYLHSESTKSKLENLFDLFRKFNCGFTFGQWLYVYDIIKEMHTNSWSQWRQAEWAGWFLEYKFDAFINKNHLENQMRYIGVSNKKADDLDFDIRFEEVDFYGDLKASDYSKKEAPGNDQNNLVKVISEYNRFWYIIYEHETKKDSIDTGYEATKARNKFIKEIDQTYNKDEMSYSNRMKHSVKFVRMTIIELNRVNFRDAFITFNQGRQPNGKPRLPKFNINKKVLDNDNYVVFRYVYKN